MVSLDAVSSSTMDDNFSAPSCDQTSPALSVGMEETRQGKIMMATSDLAQDEETNSRRKMYPKEQWLALKPLIYRLYINQNQTFNKVAEYLDGNHGFNPTKKQFLRKVKEWGFEKNVKRDERKAILESLGEGVNGEGFEARMLRGRRLDMAKLERWRKRDQLKKTDSSAPADMQLDNWDGTMEEIPPHREELQLTTIQVVAFNPWLAVDFGSPGLTGLIGALTFETCEEIPELDLSTPSPEGQDETSNLMNPVEHSSSVSKEVQKQRQPPRGAKSLSFSIAAISTCFSRQNQRRMPSPLDEIYPFPRSAERKRVVEPPPTHHLLSEYSLRTKEFECKTKLQGWKTMGRSKIIDLVENMRSIAWRHYELDHFRLSESWWRRVVTCSLAIPGYQPFKVLHACLTVVDNLRLQGKLLKAQNLHRGVHQKILHLVDPEHELALLSKRRLSDLHNNFGDFQSELTTIRELLQVCILQHGARDSLTVEVLALLGNALLAHDRSREAETILCIQMELEGDISPYADRDVLKTQSKIYYLARLAVSLGNQGRFDDSARILDIMKERFKHVLGIENPSCWCYYKEKAEVLRAKGKPIECEEILRAILGQELNHPDLDMMDAMGRLVDLLKNNGRGSEAAAWLKKMFLMGIELCGVTHWLSRLICEELGSTYAEQGRYDDAILHFQQTIEKLALCQDGDSVSQAEYVDEIHEWICEVEEMREKAQVLEIQPELEDVPRSFIDSTWDGCQLTA